MGHRQWWMWLNSWENSFLQKYCWCFDEKKNTFLPMKPKATNAISNGPAKQYNAVVEFITKRKFGVQTRHFCQVQWACNGQVCCVGVHWGSLVTQWPRMLGCWDRPLFLTSENWREIAINLWVKIPRAFRKLRWKNALPI